MPSLIICPFKSTTLFTLSLNSIYPSYLLGAGGTLILIMIMYGLSSIPFSYVVSFLAKTPAAGFTMIIIVNVLAGCIAPIAAYILKGINVYSIKSKFINFQPLIVCP